MKFSPYPVKFRCFNYHSGQIESVDSENLGYFLEGADGITLMLFTGRKDKNDREIYEGDICNIRRYAHLDKTKAWFKGQVIWGCEYGWGFRSYYTSLENSDFFGTRFIEADEIEIIGNIFENPELIKQ